jgi:hypothetical protein
MSRIAGTAPAALLPALLAAALLVPTDLRAQSPLSPEHERIDFLVGEWRTTSEFPDGRVAQGDLRYRWVLDGGWMQVTFFGEAPEGEVWETHAMQRWNPEEGSYESLVFRDGGPPVRYRGTAPEPGTYRIEGTAADGTTIGIDYRDTRDGGIYQENWAMEDGERRVTLRTTYRRAGS